MSGNRISQALIICLALGLVLVTVNLVSADIPRKINYQMRVTDGSTGEGLPGSHTIVFRIYDAVTDGSLLWSEEQVAIADAAGVLSAILGSDTSIEASFEGPCWLEVEVDGEVLVPRREMVSVPFAFHALNSDSLGGLGSASFSLVGHTHDEAYVNVGEDSSVTETMVVPDIVSSIDGVTNDGGDIDLVAGTNITITPDDANDRITIEAAGSAAGDITAVYADGGLSGGATEGDAHLSVNTGTGIEISSDSVSLTSDYSSGSAYDSRFVNEGEASSVTEGMVVPDIVSSVDGVVNDGGDIDLVAGSNISITPDDGANTITVAVTGVGDGHSLDAVDGSPVDVVYVDDAGEVGIGTTGPVAKLDVRGTLNVGTNGAGHDVNSYGDESGSRLFWNESKMALRAGIDEEDFWSEANTGLFSAAFGENIRADGRASFAAGNYAGALEFASIAMGYEVWAYGDSSVAIGSHAAADHGAVAIGSYVDADAPNSFVIGRGLGVKAPLENNTPNSLMVGFENTEPALIVKGPDPHGSYSGRVGIGTSNPFVPLETPGPVKIGTSGWSPTSAVGLMIIANDNTPTSFPLTIMNQDSDRLLYVFGDGRVSCGTNSPVTRFHFADSDIDLGADALYADVAVIEDTDAILGLYSTGAGVGGSAITFGEIGCGELVDKWGIVRESTSGGDGGLRITYGTDNDQFVNDVVMYLDDTRRVGIGTRSVGTYELFVAGDAYATGGWTPSDLRFKKEIEEIGSALDKVLDLRGVLFRWRTEEYGEKNFPEGRHYGVIAQEAEEVLPEIVKEGPDGEKAIAYSEIIPVLIESIKELKAENEALKERLASVEVAVGMDD